MSINGEHRNPRYLPEHVLPDDLIATTALDEAVKGASAVVMAVPSHGFRDVFSRDRSGIVASVPILSLTKGIEQETLATMTQVVADVSPGHDTTRIGVMTGPNLASEIVAGQPTAAVIAFPDSAPAVSLQEVFMGPTFRVYTNDDVPGCEFGGALKNVMAIAAGMSDGLGFGDNTRATLITRALAELTRLGTALGRPPFDVCRPGRHGRPHRHMHLHRQPQPSGRVRAGPGKASRQMVEEMKMVAEGSKDHPGRPRSR